MIIAEINILSYVSAILRFTSISSINESVKAKCPATAHIIHRLHDLRSSNERKGYQALPANCRNPKTFYQKTIVREPISAPSWRTKDRNKEPKGGALASVDRTVQIKKERKGRNG